MSWQKHDDNCPGCLPAMLNAETGEQISPDSPEMQAVYAVWDKTTVGERHAWHRVNSRNQVDLMLSAGIAHRIQRALKALETPRSEMN